MKTCASALLTLFVFTAPAFAGVTVNNPSNSDTVSSPFTLSASAASCASQSVSSMSYSLDSGSDLTTVSGQSLDVQVSSAAGAHTMHVKAWGDNGAACVTDVAVNVTAAAADSSSSDFSSDTSLAPSSATGVSSIQALKSWSAEHDSGTSGSSSGKTSLVGSPAHSGTTREFATSFHGSSGERYSVNFGENQTATHFVYDGWIYIKSPSSHIANIELDVNQTMPNGQTVIFGVQCAGYSGRWEYTENLGTASHPKGHWASSSAPCNPRSWSANTWHHVQAEYSRSSTGHITYDAVWLDGHQYTLNKTVFGARAMGWGPSLSTNFQVDGTSTGSATAYLDELTIYRW